MEWKSARCLIKTFTAVSGFVVLRVQPVGAAGVGLAALMDDLTSVIGAAAIHQAALIRFPERSTLLRADPVNLPPPSPRAPDVSGPHHLPPPPSLPPPRCSVCGALLSPRRRAAVADVRTLFWMIGKPSGSRRVTGTHMVRARDSSRRPVRIFS